MPAAKQTHHAAMHADKSIYPNDRLNLTLILVKRLTTVQPVTLTTCAYGCARNHIMYPARLDTVCADCTNSWL